MSSLLVGNELDVGTSCTHTIICYYFSIIFMLRLSNYFPLGSLSFEDFCDICRKEPPTNENDLMRAFRKIDTSGDGFISNAELRKVLTTVGERSK